MFHLILIIINFVLGFLISCKCSSSGSGTSRITWTTCQYESMTNYLQNIQQNYSNITKLISIGQSVEGRELWVIVISESIEERPLLRPQVKLVGNVNGNSGPSCYILLKLINNLVSGFAQESSLERRIVETNEIHISPNINPDGLSKSSPGACSGDHGKFNAQGINLNRDFPDIYFSSDARTLQPETWSIIQWIQQNNFMLSLSFMTGASGVIYPFDSVQRVPDFPQLEVPGPHHTPDDDMFVHLAKSYVNNANGDWYCPNLGRPFLNGIVNGADWSPATGTMMDYNYIEGTFELLIGVSCCRNEDNIKKLEEVWENNHQAILRILTETEYGLRGQVIDRETLKPIANASMIKLPRRNNPHGSSVPMPWKTTEEGEFWRLILPGRYELKVRADGYEEKKVLFEIKPTQFTRLIVELDKTKPKKPLGKPPSIRSTKESGKHHQTQLQEEINGFYESISGTNYIEGETDYDHYQKNHQDSSSGSKQLGSSGQTCSSQISVYPILVFVICFKPFRDFNL